jgi:probable F420-dependent oxidoreductase
MDFGFTLKAEHSVERTIALTQQAEAAGFTYGWFWDNHVLWREIYPLLTLLAVNTSTMRLGACVTNPTTRDPSVTASVLATLQELSGGRMDLGMGRGDGAVRLLGLPPTRLKAMEQAIEIIRELAEGRSVDYRGTHLDLTWTDRAKLPVWVAAYGPMALSLTGRVADGLILQIGDPALVEWMAGTMRRAASDAGRDPDSIMIQAAAPAHVGDLEECRERTKWFPAMVANHVVDLVKKVPPDELPESLTGYITDREEYDYRHHAEVGSSNADYIEGDVIDRFSVLGEPDVHVERLLQLADVGVDQFNIYLMNGDEEEQLEIYGREIIPAVNEALAARA